MTLFETLVATAILVMISALAFPAMDRSAQSLALAHARVQLFSDVRAAHGRAIAQNRAVRVAPIERGRGYAFDGAERALPDGALLTGAGDDGALIFYPDGSAAGGPLRFVARGAHIAIVADAATGVVRLADGAARGDGDAR